MILKEWTSCNKYNCKHYLSGPVELEYRGKAPKIALWISFTQHEHIGSVESGGTKWATYPCQFCEHYEPTKFDLFRAKEVKP